MQIVYCSAVYRSPSLGRFNVAINHLTVKNASGLRTAGRRNRRVINVLNEATPLISSDSCFNLLCKSIAMSLEQTLSGKNIISRLFLKASSARITKLGVNMSVYNDAFAIRSS